MTGQNALKVVHVAEDVSAIAGGVPAVVQQLSRHLAASGASVQIVHAQGNPGELPASMRAWVYPPEGIGRIWSWGGGLKKGITELTSPTMGSAPVFHLHGVWSAPQYFAARAAHKSGTPFIVTSHGMLEPWLWAQQGWRVHAKKQAYWKLFAYPVLKRASVVHAITTLERQHLHDLFPNNRIEVIPNAIDLDDFACGSEGDGQRERLILFIGRIEPKKGVDILLRAFAGAKISSDWRVTIVGPVWSEAYRMELDKIVAEGGLQERVTFAGPVFGEEKYHFLRKAWVMAVPSHSEVVGLVNLEAGAYRLPTITTHQTGLDDWELGGGMLIQPDVEEMRNALEKACSWSDEEREARGQSSRRLVEDRYSWKAVLPQWIALYESLRLRG